MKIAESWLREWVDPDPDIAALGERLTMAGHELDGLVTEGAGLDGVVIGEVLEVSPHPDADRLRVCTVSRGDAEPLNVVCGAPNVVAGMKSPLAVPGVTLPNGVKLRKSKLRGVVSEGMLCSAIELALGEESDGIMALPGDAPVGADLPEYLGLPDTVIDLDLTPNRGDCFSVLGIARDVAALTDSRLGGPELASVPATIDASHPVEIDYPDGCPVFAGRVVKGIELAATSPLWLQERLRRCGLRPISPVVDVTNYVMLELGQPLHAYDLAKLQGPIRPRLAKSGEKVVLLDDKEVAVNADTLVISDDSGPIGLAGIMGGLSTAVTDATVDVFFEAAFWPPEHMAGRARAYGLHTDASLRFERGVDPAGQARAVERATELLLAIAGGEAGPLAEIRSDAHVPTRSSITLRRSRLDTLLGVTLDAATVTRALEALGMHVEESGTGWVVTPPSYRFDVEIEVDLIEEVARVYGYDAIPEATAIAATPLAQVTESVVDIDRAAATLVARDYREVITYSFVDADSDRLLSGVDSSLLLSNPISTEMAVMRTSLWPGLLKAIVTNLSRQHERVRLFEIGKSFHGALGSHEEIVRLAAAITGPAVPEQWGSRAQTVDFFDIKSDIEALLALTGRADECRFVEADHPALQPGQAARILRDDVEIGVLGKLHPQHSRLLDIKRDVFVFELDAARALASSPPTATPVSKYPSIRRDIAVVVDTDVSVAALVAAVTAAAPTLMADVRVFDIYTGSGIEAGRKSVALGLILQETSRTLTDVDADSAMAAAVQKLQDEFAAELRD